MMKLWLSFCVSAVREVSSYGELGSKYLCVEARFCKTAGPRVKNACGPASLTPSLPCYVACVISGDMDIFKSDSLRGLVKPYLMGH